MNRKHALRYLLLSSVVATCSGQALAQTPADPQSQMIEDIVVTAQKREQSLNKVGMTINAATGLELQQRGISSVNDLVKIEPSFAVTTNALGNPIFAIRGISFNSDAIGAPPAVSVYVDQVAFPFAALAKGATLDVERIEILKGPQGTLFGQSATGGAINYIAAKPTDELKLGVDATYARFNAVKLDGFVSGPITDTLRARLAVSLEKGGAWQRSMTRDDSLGDKNNKYVRLLLDWTPTDRLKVSLNLNGWTNNSETQVPGKYALAVQVPAFTNKIPIIVNAPIATRPRDADWTPLARPKNDQDYYQGSLRADYEISDALTLTYVGTYQHYKQNDRIQFSGTAAPFHSDQLATVRSTAHEIRAGGRLLDNKLDWLIGGTYSKDKDSENIYSDLRERGTGSTGSSGVWSITLVPGSTGPNVFYNSVMTQNIETKAIFGNLEFHILDNLGIHGGARYTKINNAHTGCTLNGTQDGANGFTGSMNARRAALGLPPAAPQQIGQCLTLNQNIVPKLQTDVDMLKEDNVSWRFGIDWTPIEQTLIYATASKGYKAGSFTNIAATSSPALAPAVQESVLAYEVGFKSRLAGGRLQVNGAAFYYDYRNKQQQLRTPVPIFGTLNKLLNVPKASVKGAELMVTYLPTQGLSLNGAVTYLNSKIVGDFPNFDQFAVSRNLKDDPLPGTPKWAFNVGARYDFAIGSGHGAYVAGDVRYQSSTQSYFGGYQARAAGLPSMVNDSYALLNLRAGVETSDERWRVELFGENVTNTFYTIHSVKLDTVSRYAGMPATYGVRVSFRY